MTTLAAPVCACEMPMVAVKPSGAVYCAACGLPVIPKRKPEDRP